MIIILTSGFVFVFVFQFNIIPGQHENEMKEISGDIKEESKSQTGKDRVIYELRAEVRYWIRIIIPKYT